MVLSSTPGPVLIYRMRILIFKLRASLHIGGWWPKRRSQAAQRSPKDRPRSTFQQLPNGIHASSKQFRRSTVNHTYMKTQNSLRNQTCETTRNPYCVPMYKSSCFKHMPSGLLLTKALALDCERIGNAEFGFQFSLGVVIERLGGMGNILRGTRWCFGTYAAVLGAMPNQRIRGGPPIER